MPLNISVDRGHAVVDPATLAVGTVVKVYGTVPLAYRRALVGLAGSTANVLHLSSVAHVALGMWVAGANIPANATIVAINGTAITLSKAVTGTVASGAAIEIALTKVTTAATASGTNLAVPTAGLYNGMIAIGANIPNGATITIVDANNVTLSSAVTAAVASGASIVFALPNITASAATSATATQALNLRVTTTDPDGLVGTTYENVIGAVVYNEAKVSFGEVARFAARGWSLVPMANITPASPTFL